MIDPTLKPHKPRVFDCITFFNEYDLLEIRLHEMSSTVDVFVIAESSKTFKGEPKPLYFAENRHRFEGFLDRIRHIVVDDMPSGNTEADHWQREYHQRNQMMQALNDLHPDDIVLLSDVDEILRPSAIAAAAARDEAWPTVHFYELAMYRFYLDLRRHNPWLRNGPRSVRFKHLRTLQELRNARPPSRNLIKSATRWLKTSFSFQMPIRRIVHRDAGWHFTSLGGPDSLSKKLSSYAHVQKDPRLKGMTEKEIATLWIKEGLASSEYTRTPIDEYYPEFIQHNADRYRHLLSDNLASPHF